MMGEWSEDDFFFRRSYSTDSSGGCDSSPHKFKRPYTTTTGAKGSSTDVNMGFHDANSSKKLTKMQMISLRPSS